MRKHEIIQHIYVPVKEEGWILLKTNESLYSLRLGGFKRETEPIAITGYEDIDFPFKNYCIQRVVTDDEWVYILLDNKAVIASGWTSIAGSGEMGLGVQCKNLDNYDEHFFDSGFLSELTTDNEGWSTK